MLVGMDYLLVTIWDLILNNKQDDEIVHHLIKGETLVLKHRFYIEAGKDKISKEQADAIGVDFSKSY